MTLFAVYHYRGRSEDIRFVVRIQSRRLERFAGGVVMPLLRLRYRAPPDHPLTPHITVQGLSFYADPLDVAAVPVSRLGEIVAIFAESDQDRIIRALDDMVSRA